MVVAVDQGGREGGILGIMENLDGMMELSLHARTGLFHHIKKGLNWRPLETSCHHCGTCFVRFHKDHSYHPCYSISMYSPQDNFFAVLEQAVTCMITCRSTALYPHCVVIISLVWHSSKSV